MRNSHFQTGPQTDTRDATRTLGTPVSVSRTRNPASLSADTDTYGHGYSIRKVSLRLIARSKPKAISI